MIDRSVYSNIRNQLSFKSNNVLTAIYIILDIFFALLGLWLTQQGSWGCFIISQLLYRYSS
jgi:uncharacterized membrane protein